jgi:hypothetical protein
MGAGVGSSGSPIDRSMRSWPAARRRATSLRSAASGFGPLVAWAGFVVTMRAA